MNDIEIKYDRCGIITDIIWSIGENMECVPNLFYKMNRFESIIDSYTKQQQFDKTSIIGLLDTKGVLVRKIGLVEANRMLKLSRI